MIPDEALTGIRLGRLTVLQKKPDGGVREIVVGDIMRSSSGEES